MLKLVEKRGLGGLRAGLPPSLLRRRACPLTAGQRVSRRYRRASIRRAEYKKLKAIVPSIASRNKVTKVEVIEEAIKYIDELHKALYDRMPLLRGNFPPPSSPAFLEIPPECLVARVLRGMSAPSTLHVETSAGGASLPGSFVSSNIPRQRSNASLAEPYQPLCSNKQQLLVKSLQQQQHVLCRQLSLASRQQQQQSIMSAVQEPRLLLQNRAPGIFVPVFSDTCSSAPPVTAAGQL